MKNYSIAHDSYYCEEFSNTMPFPVKRPTGPNNFVGAIILDGSSLKTPCPIPCRPLDHQDWTIC